MEDYNDHGSGHDDSGHESDVGDYIRKHGPRGMTVKKDIIGRINKGKGPLSVSY